ncbi:electron transport complex protein RnfE [Klebsiella pneumoniae]|uniref:Electron transport complex protein RnfE n=1 Tax=Klebsiella pneumoniae TaxID=573 RepID=A0A2X3ETD3_KLEPN|nr:electron transport complex protein RnfE [Klebsiella pneumoniae]
MSEVKDVIVQGLWKNNSALVQLLGMCPLLAVTSTATNALRAGFGHHPGVNPDQPDHLQPAPLDAGGDPDPHLRNDYRLGGERRADADQRLCLPASISRWGFSSRLS